MGGDPDAGLRAWEALPPRQRQALDDTLRRLEANENALLWRPGRTVRDYLAAAGVLPEADASNLFVVRADGSVVHSRDRSAGFLFGGNRIESLSLAPGDAIVVPDRLDRERQWNAFVRGAKDWTQILSNFGIAAAAIKTLRD